MKAPSTSQLFQFDRREFLGIAAVSAGAVLLNRPVFGASNGLELPTHSFHARRGRDLLSLEFSFVNFERRKDELFAIGDGRSRVIVRFPPQNLAEARFDKLLEKTEPGKDAKLPDLVEPSPTTETVSGQQLIFEELPLPLADGPKHQCSPIPPITSYLSGPSWVVFNVANDIRIPLSTSAAERSGNLCTGNNQRNVTVLDIWLRMMGDWPILVPAKRLSPIKPAMPANDETCLEIPFRLFISPLSETAKWLTSSSPRLPFEPPNTRNVELWHAALFDRKKINAATLPPGFENIPDDLAPPKRVAVQARAVFSPDYKDSGKPDWATFYPGLMPLSHRAQTRHMLVDQMNNGDGWIDAEHLILTALGADASLHYNTQKTFREIHDQQLAAGPKYVQPPLAIWKHRMVIGRDVFLLDVRMGFLMPFVFPALFVELTKRSFAASRRRDDPEKFGPPGAYLLTERFILVQDPVRQYSSSEDPLGRKMPVKKVTLLEKQSPLIRTPDQNDIETPFIPRMLAGGKEVRWPIEFIDENGTSSKTTDACLLFASNVVQGHEKWAEQPDEFTNWRMAAQQMAFSPDKAELRFSKNDGIPESIRYTFPNSDRAALANLSNELRKWLPSQGSADPGVLLRKIGELHSAGTSLPDSLNQTLASVSVDSLAAVTAAAKQLQTTDGKTAKDNLDNLLRQLGRAQQVSSQLEVHSVKFASRRVDTLYAATKAKLGPLLDGAASMDAFLANVKTAIPQMNASQPVFDLEVAQFQQELQSRLAGSTQSWPDQRKELQSFLREINTAQESAQDFFRHGFQPQLDSAQVVVPALKAMGGNLGPQQFKLVDDYVSKGIANVENGVYGKFNQLVDEGSAMASHVKCAVAAPATRIAGMSRDLGALTGSGPDAITALAQKATDFKIDDAIPDFKILGVLPMSKLVSAALGASEIPTINMVNLPDHVEQIWEWTTELRESPSIGFVTFNPNPNKFPKPVHIYIRMVTRVDLPKPQQAVNGAPPAARVHLEGKIAFWDEVGKKPLETDDEQRAFSLRLLGLIDVKFRDLSFDAEYPLGGDPNPKLRPRLGEVEFLPPLDFVKDLQDMLPVLGDGFRVVQTAGYIGISYTFQLPAIAFGAFSLMNLSIGSAVMFSLEGRPLRFDFNFSSWEEPFQITVMCFGGRGFMKIAADTGGYRDVQGMLEFGGALAFDVGVASGGLYVMGGIYFRITDKSNDVSGFIRAGGCVDVLGLIHASIEFLLMMSYVKSGGQSLLTGIARVTVSIDLFLVSFDVTIEMRKDIVGSKNENKNGGSARLRFDGPIRFASFAPEPSSDTPIPHAYFQRNSATLGRFTSVDQWNREYWSQFAF